MRVQTVFLAAMILTLPDTVSSVANPGRSKDLWVGTWKTTWPPAYSKPDICVRVWLTTEKWKPVWRDKTIKKGTLVGSRHRGGPFDVCSLLIGDVAERYDLWDGQEYNWSYKKPLNARPKAQFRLVRETDGARFGGVRYDGPAVVNAWWGFKEDCQVSMEAFDNCDYPPGHGQ